MAGPSLTVTLMQDDLTLHTLAMHLATICVAVMGPQSFAVITLPGRLSLNEQTVTDYNRIVARHALDLTTLI